MENYGRPVDKWLGPLAELAEGVQYILEAAGVLGSEASKSSFLARCIKAHDLDLHAEADARAYLVRVLLQGLRDAPLASDMLSIVMQGIAVGGLKHVAALAVVEGERMPWRD